MARLKWTAEQIEHSVYADVVDDLKDGGNPLKPEDYTFKANPRIKLIRELLKTRAFEAPLRKSSCCCYQDFFFHRLFNHLSPNDR